MRYTPKRTESFHWIFKCESKTEGERERVKDIHAINVIHVKNWQYFPTWIMKHTANTVLMYLCMGELAFTWIWMSYEMCCVLKLRFKIHHTTLWNAVSCSLHEHWAHGRLQWPKWATTPSRRGASNEKDHEGERERDREWKIHLSQSFPLHQSRNVYYRFMEWHINVIML